MPASDTSQPAPADICAALPAQRGTLLALLRGTEGPEPDPDRLARIAVTDPALCCALLCASPAETGGEPFDLGSAIAARLARLGPDLLRALCLLQLRGRPAAEASARPAAHAVFVAELALHIAAEGRLGNLHEAYIAGLLHDLGQDCAAAADARYAELRQAARDEDQLAAMERGARTHDHGALGAALIARCGLSAGIADAVYLHHAPYAVLADAEPLARVLRAAEDIANGRTDSAGQALAQAARLCGLEAATLAGLQADVGRQVTATLAELGIAANGGLLDFAWSPAAPPAAEPLPAAGDPGAAAGIDALLRLGFAACEDEAALTARLRLACRLMLGADAPLLLVVEADGALVALPDAERPWTRQLELSATNPASVLTEALRAGAGRRCLFAGHAPRASAVDWHLSRRLGGPGLLCLPWRNRERGLAVFAACEDGEAAAQTVALRSALVDAVAAGWSALAARRRAHADVERRLNARWRARLQRLVHEAGNPLAAVRSLLGLAMQRQDVEPTLRGQLGLMDTELARMAALLREGQGAEAGAEAAADGCRVGELLRELVALYGESLFAPGGRRLEREPAPADPRVRLPADTLRQVLANLLRNAAEALPPGGTCRLSVSDVVNIDGAPGVELRVADDGPGMTPAALAALFSAQTRGRPGNQGIGLAIVRELLARHGARIVCESRAGGGTLFRLLLPLADRPPAAAGGATRP